MQIKTSVIIFFLFSFLFILFSGCEKKSTINDNNTIYGSGKIATQTRSVEECSGLTIKNIGNIYLTQDAEQSIRIEADDNIIDEVITRKENETLLVGLNDGSYSNITLKVFVSLKTICNLTIEGAGKIDAGNSIWCDTMNCIINGAGNLTLQGNSDHFNCKVNGAGNISAKDFITKKCKAILCGAGTMTLFVTEELDAVVEGVGTINYYGNPPVVRSSISGVGQIIRR